MSFLYDQSPVGKGFNGDLFGRVKVSEPLTLFDDSERYEISPTFSIKTGGNGTTTSNLNQSSMSMTVGTSSGDYVYRESKRIFTYQPGKSLQVLQTFVFNSPKTNLRQRVGYFSVENGFYLELDGTTINLVKRSKSSGEVVETRVPQSQWNVDKLNGTGPSGYTLDLTKSQILFSEYEWLGVGSVRMGFAIDGKFIIVHQFNHANVISGVYMTTANLPVRYEIENTGVTSSASSLQCICVSVISNGGYERKVTPTISRMTTMKNLTSTSFIPLLTIRMKSGRTDSIIIPNTINVLADSTSGMTYEVALIRNATLTGASYINTDSNNVEMDITASALTGGTQVYVDYASTSNKVTTPINEPQQYNFDMQLGRTIDGVSDTLTLAARAISGTGTIIGSLSFYDLT
jgi:hypothetical protein